MADKPKAAPKIALPPKDMLPRETAVMSYHVIIPPGHTREMIESPGYWCHVARKLRRNSRIEVVAHDFSFWGDLLVMQAEETYANVAVLAWVGLEAKAKPEDFTSLDDYKFDSIATGWRVIHKVTGKVVKEGLATRQDAIKAASELVAKAA